MSGNAFCDAFYKSNSETGFPDPIFMEMVDKDRDSLLRFFDLSPQYQEQVKKNPAIKEPFHKFCARWVPDIAIRISKHIGSHPEWIPSNESVIAMWRACIHQTVVHENTSGFYTLWNPQDALVMNYAYDLHHFSLQGPKYPISTTISSSFYDAILLNQREKKNGLYFAHEETVVPIVDALGLFYENLSEDYNLQQIEKRVWNLSEIAPYSTNVGFLFYTNSSGQVLVVVLHKGTPVSLPGQEIFCPFEAFYNIVRKGTGK